MTVKQVSDLCLREAGRGFIVSLKVSNRYSASYLEVAGATTMFSPRIRAPRASA